MSLEEIMRRAQAQSAENEQLKLNTENQETEASINNEVADSFTNREEQVKEYEQRLQNLEQRQTRLADAENTRTGEIQEMSKLRITLENHNSEIAQSNDMQEQIKTMALSEAEKDTYLREILSEQNRILTEKQNIESALEDLKSKSESSQAEIEELSRDYNPADIKTLQPDLSPEAMAKIQEEALTENEQFNEKKVEEERMVNEKKMEEIARLAVEISKLERDEYDLDMLIEQLDRADRQRDNRTLSIGTLRNFINELSQNPAVANELYQKLKFSNKKDELLSIKLYKPGADNMDVDIPVTMGELMEELYARDLPLEKGNDGKAKTLSEIRADKNKILKEKIADLDESKKKIISRASDAYSGKSAEDIKASLLV